MALADGLIQDLNNSIKWFKNTLSVLESGDAAFAPKPGMFTVAGQVAHAAQTVDWFVEGAFGKGWDMDFEGHAKEVLKVTTLEDAVAWLDRAFGAAVERIGSASDEELTGTMEDTSLMGPAPRMAIISGIVDHTAHHRGSLAVYARMLGKVPQMPYS